MPLVVPINAGDYVGNVVLAKPLTLPQYHAWQMAVEKVLAGEKEMNVSDIAKDPLRSQTLLEGIVPCVEIWNLTNFPPVVVPETFPSTPRLDSMNVFSDVTTALIGIIKGETTRPPA